MPIRGKEKNFCFFEFMCGKFTIRVEDLQIVLWLAMYYINSVQANLYGLTVNFAAK